jgi:drug/metabolite transporter (DMT)-like permease
MSLLQRGDRTWLVALAASLWGLSALWRSPLAKDYPSLTIVFWEHLILVVLVSPWLMSAVQRVLLVSVRTKLAVLVIGAGSSALATTLFTAAFRFGDPITPQVLQKLQPVIAVVLAAVILGERLRVKFLLFVVPAVIGAWMLAFADPLSVTVASAQAALLALGAASLWAAGTVLGRMASAELGFRDLAVLRFSIGLVTLTVLAIVTGAPLGMRWSAAPSLLLLAIFRGWWR